MVPASFAESNGLLDKPDCMTREQCGAQAALFTRTDDGHQATITCWKLTREELEELTKTGRVWLTIIGNQVPPIAVSVRKPFS